MDLASCAEPAVVCDDNPSPPLDWGLVALDVVVVAVLLAVVLLVLWAAAQPSPRRTPARRTWVSADGDVVRQEWVDGTARR